MREQFSYVTLVLALDLGPEAHALLADAPLDDLLQAGEGAPADEKDVGRVDGQELLVRVLAPALGRHTGRGAFQDLEQSLLHPFSGDIPGDGGVVRLAGDLVDLIDVDDPGLGLLDIEVGGLDKLEQDVLDVLPHVSGFRESRGVGDGEGHVEDAGQGLGEKGLTAARGAEQQDIGLLQFYVALVAGAHVDPLVVIVDRYRESTFGLFLADDVVGEDAVDLFWLGKVLELQGRRDRQFLVDDLVAEIDTLIADVDPRPGDELLDLTLALPTKAAEQLFGTSRRLRHQSTPSYLCSMILSTIPYARASSAVMK